jgi:Tol biopolymer transport system component
MSILTRPQPPRSDVPSDAEALEALIEEARRRTRRRRRGYAAVALVATAAGLLGFYGLNHGGSGATRAQDSPPSQATNLFAQLRGWIVYTDLFAFDGDEVGIWAVDPTRPEADASDLIQLIESPAAPLDWSADGTKLLISRVTDAKRIPTGWEGGDWRLFVLNADGTETTVLRRERTRTGWMHGASLSPDGSQVVYSWYGRRYDSGVIRGSGIYVVGTDGGRPHLIKQWGRRQCYVGNGCVHTYLSEPTFSPDGTKIAYLDGWDWGHGLRVMNADGSHVRELIKSDEELFRDNPPISHLVWSPDGSQLAFEGWGGI